MANSESLGFRIVTVVILTIIAGFALAVIIYFNQIKQGKTITTSEAFEHVGNIRYNLRHHDIFVDLGSHSPIFQQERSR